MMRSCPELEYLRRHVGQRARTLYNAFGSRQVATILTASNDYAVILEGE
jgi:hypothetical protein